MDFSNENLQQLLVNSLSMHKTADISTATNIGPKEMSHVYVNAIYFAAAMGYIKDQLWLEDQQSPKNWTCHRYTDFISVLFRNELLPLGFLKDLVSEFGPSGMQELGRASKLVEDNIICEVMTWSRPSQKTFLMEALTTMKDHFSWEEKLQEGRTYADGHKGPCLYRTLDRLDEILGLDYSLDKGASIKNYGGERLYVGSGIGVQSGYSTILLALNHLNIGSGGRIVDLGSGYGRVGLVSALLRPDLDFIGYEYVPHRVQVANEACNTLGLTSHLGFKVQDLSHESFMIPEADVFYLYDPFTEETYAKMLKQMVNLSLKNKITIVTKGNAKGWLSKISLDYHWPPPMEIDGGNLCIFKSQ